jgi:DNA modification methylase
MKKNYRQYYNFLRSKIKLAENTGFDISMDALNPILKPHQGDICAWALRGGRRAVFAAFGLGKTFIQLEIATHCVKQTNKPFLIGLPLGVRYEFALDAAKMGYSIKYVKDMHDVEVALKEGIYILISNYERIRDGKFEASAFGGVSFDEASILRGLDTETADYILNNFTQIPYRFVCTATPTPNEYTEILNYAQFLGIMDRGQALTRFFQRDSQHAGHLTLYPHKEKEFWMWVSSWAVFVTKPSDLGYSDEGYDLPKMKIIYHKVNVDERGTIVNRDNQTQMFRNPAASLVEASREKRDSLDARVEKMSEIIRDDIPHTNYLIWHHLEAEREAIEKALPNVKSVYGKQDTDEREDYLIGFGAGRYQYLSTKPEIAGSGCNFQRFCHKAIFLGIDYKFNDFIQAVHRIYRFMQLYEVEIHILYSDAEEQVLKTLQQKWTRHNELVQNMVDIIKTYGLSNTPIIADLSRTIGVERKEIKGNNYTCVRNDNVLETFDTPDNSIDLDVTSIPFGDQYEYSESYHDMGHNFGNREFFEQLDFLTPEMYRTLKPGRIACIHVKDRIRYSYQNGVGFTSLEDFSGQTVAHFVKHGFHLMGKITITTDVVRENNQTYRLGWTEQCKDGTKMGVGLPEYLLIFRKPPTDKSNAFADVRVEKSKDEYTVAQWQHDAHAYWRSGGDRFMTDEELKQADLKRIAKAWKIYNTQGIYNFNNHVRECIKVDEVGKLSKEFMLMPAYSNNLFVWDDVNRMLTLNSNQARKKLEKHICPLQFDIVDRCITRFSNPGEVVRDVFGGLMTVPFRAIKLGRRGFGIELNDISFKDGIKYCRDAETVAETKTLFDLVEG